MGDIGQKNLNADVTPGAAEEEPMAKVIDLAAERTARARANHPTAKPR